MKESGELQEYHFEVPDLEGKVHKIRAVTRESREVARVFAYASIYNPDQKTLARVLKAVREKGATMKTYECPKCGSNKIQGSAFAYLQGFERLKYRCETCGYTYTTPTKEQEKGESK